MQALFYILVAVAIAVGIWQITKIFNLTSTVTNAKNNNLQGKLLLGFLIVFYLFMFFTVMKWKHVFLPDAASEEGVHYDTLWTITMTVIIIVQLVTQFALFFFAYKYRGVEGRKAVYETDSHKLEIIWTTIPTIVLTILIGYGLWVWTSVMDNSDSEDPLIIELYAKQFSWEARYAGQDGQLGRGNVRNIKGINTMGVDMTDVNAQDDIPVRELHLPKGRKIIFKFRSQDVLHSAYMPHFRAQMNCVPGMITEFGFTPSKTTEEMRLDPDVITKVDGINEIRAEKGEDPYEFDYLLLCNKICGSSHYNMQMKIVVEEPAEFNKWMASQKTMAQVVQ
ncbi:MAG: cytochrome c oxidase subunit II [Flavobacteriaceae bacterium]